MSRTSAVWMLAAVVLGLSPTAVTAAVPQPLAGWKIELIAQAPDVRHPSVVCSAPDGRVFVAEDPMDISAPANSDQGRIVCIFPDGRRTVFAEKLFAVFGMQYLEGKLYVLHNPKFTVFRDDNGVGRDRSDLIESMNPNPWALDWNDHVPANFKLAMDGFFYLASGDKGIYQAKGRDGRVLNLHGGGVVRLRPDATGLEVYATGVRNILDVALNAEDDVFTFDNTDEHDWMGRLTHMIDGGFYGYPYDFVPRRPYTLWMMHDFGAGAACGAQCYVEDALPAEYSGNLFLADFGKRQVLRVRLERQGATYGVAEFTEFFKDPPDDFRPVGITWSADGLSLYVCDWQHRDDKENVSVGRLWKVTYTGESHAQPKPQWYLPAAMGQSVDAPVEMLVAGLSHSAKSVRLVAQRQLSKMAGASPGSTSSPQPSATKSKVVEQLQRVLSNPSAEPRARWHALWALDSLNDPGLARPIVKPLLNDPEPTMRRQAIRELAMRGDASVAALIIPALADANAAVRCEAAIGLGRIGSAAAISNLSQALAENDFFTRYAVFAALNRIGRRNPSAWPEIARGLSSSNERMREGTEFALRATYDARLVDVLAALASSASAPNGSEAEGNSVRESALRLLALLHHQTPEWKGEWWAYHPALSPPAEKTEEWMGTSKVLAALRAALSDASSNVRLTAIEGLREAKDTNAVPMLLACFNREKDVNVRQAILATAGDFHASEFVPIVLSLLQETNPVRAGLRHAIDVAGQLGGRELEAALLKNAANEGLDGVTRSEAVLALGKLKTRDALPKLQPLLIHSDKPLRIAAQKAVAQIDADEALRLYRPLLSESSVDIRREIVTAIGSLKTKSAVPDLLNALGASETRGEALAGLASISDIRALDAYVEALGNSNPVLREQARKALGGIREEALPILEAKAETLKPEVIAELRRVYENHSKAKQGVLFVSAKPVLEPKDYHDYAIKNSGNSVLGQRIFWDESSVGCIKCHAVAGIGGSVGPDLTLIGLQFPRHELIEHVLDPSKIVREGYQQYFIETRDGESYSGIIKSETPETLTIINSGGQSQAIAKSTIASRESSKLSLMPEGLQSGLGLDQFAHLIAYLESRRVDPRQSVIQPAPDGFQPLLNGNDFAGWNSEDVAEGHWRMHDGALEYDGAGKSLRTQNSFRDFSLRLEWRWLDKPRLEDFPAINRDGVDAVSADGKPVKERALEAGSSGVFVRGLPKAQTRLFGNPIGSGILWDYRSDQNLTPDRRKALVPKKSADKPIGDWNALEITLRGNHVTTVLNGEEVLSGAELPDLPASGPIGLVGGNGRIQFRNLFIKEL